MSIGASKLGWVALSLLTGLLVATPTLAEKPTAGKATEAKAEKKTAASIPATTGRPIDPLPPGLLETAGRLRDAALAKDPDTVFALIADDVTFVSSGITLGVPRRMTKKTFLEADAVLVEIGIAFTEGEIALPAGRRVDPDDRKKATIATALATIADRIGDARWGRDPLVVGGYCTTPGAKWDAGAAEKAGLGGHRGVFVTRETKLHAEPATSARIVGKLSPDRIHVSDEGPRDDGWTRISTGGAEGWAPPKALHDAMPWGICFLPDAQGGWLMSAVVSALN